MTILNTIAKIGEYKKDNMGIVIDNDNEHNHNDAYDYAYDHGCDYD